MLVRVIKLITRYNVYMIYKRNTSIIYTCIMCAMDVGQILIGLVFLHFR